MDEIDRKILNMIQEEFPITPRPFAELGRLVGIDEKEALDRVKKLKAEGYIRRIGPILERRKLNYASALCGVYVDQEKIAALVEDLNRHSGVTHNYEREGEPNIWFTITTKTAEEMDLFLSGLENEHAVKIYRFPEKRLFKIKTYFPV